MPIGIYQHRPRSEKTKQQIREKLIGKERPPRSKKWKENLSEGHKGLKCSDLTKEKMRYSHKGEKHWNWQGGITLLYFQVRNCFKYRQARVLISSKIFYEKFSL